MYAAEAPSAASAASGGRPLNVVVLGGGPIGLRAAAEMAMMGHRVTLLESRDGVSRLNVLKLWEETVIDLDRQLLLQLYLLLTTDYLLLTTCYSYFLLLPNCYSLHAAHYFSVCHRPRQPRPQARRLGLVQQEGGARLDGEITARAAQDGAAARRRGAGAVQPGKWGGGWVGRWNWVGWPGWVWWFLRPAAAPSA